MAMSSVHCPVLGAHVTLIADLEGNVTRVICPEYESADASCRLKAEALKGGRLAQLLERVSEETLSSRTTLCQLRSGG
jgi:hypothetical protein